MGFMENARQWIATGPLVLFFFLAGIELHAELLDGAFRKRFSFLIPISAALGGMIAPALIYLFIAKNSSAPAAAWGVPMATDLPLALLALSLLARSITNRIRGFLLALAIADDLGSIVVVAVVYHHQIDLPRLFVSGVLLLVFWKSAPRFPIVALIIGVITWGVFKDSGIHPTVIGVLLGLSINHRESNWLIGKLTRVINFLIIPAFIITTLWLPWKLTPELIFSPLVLGLILARLIGKPIGIWLLGTLSMKVLGQRLISNSDLFLVGTIGTIGLSVSMLFANLGELGQDLTGALLGILITLPLAVVLILVSAHLLKASRIQERSQEH